MKSYNNKFPEIHDSVFIAEGAYVVGDVSISKDSSIWFNAVIRGDVDKIQIGQGTNVQDGSVIHSSRLNGPTIIGDFVTIGHLAMIHACRIHNKAFIGMNATIMDKAVVESYGFVAAGALIAPGKIVKSRQLWAGVPAKYIRDITDKELWLIEDSVSHYIEVASKYISNIK